MSDRAKKSESQPMKQAKASLTQYFLVVLGVFGIGSLLLNAKLSQNYPYHAFVGNGYSGTLKAKLYESLGHNGIYDEAAIDSAKDDLPHRLAGLNCTRYGGPVNASEFVYWRDIPADSRHISPFHRKQKRNLLNNVVGDDDEEEYLTFEPDHGGWNNIRMAMETVLALAFSMGRTLVLPPEKRLYLLSQTKKTRHGVTQKHAFSFADFFHMNSIHNEHEGLNIITMEDFLQRHVMQGKVYDPKTNRPVFPPHNRTNYDGQPDAIFSWLRQYSRQVTWQPDVCLAVFPADASDTAVLEMKNIFSTMLAQNPKFEDYVGRPVPVNANTLERLKEARAGRNEMCLYDKGLQAAPILHFPVDPKAKARMLVQSYQFLFFQDYVRNDYKYFSSHAPNISSHGTLLLSFRQRHDLWIKRFIRYVQYAIIFLRLSL
jgi:hypothetical protein